MLIVNLLICVKINSNLTDKFKLNRVINVKWLTENSQGRYHLKK